VLDFEVDQNLQSVRLVTTRVLKEHPEITGLMTIREMVETAIYSAASDAGLSIPDELSVVGLTNPRGAAQAARSSIEAPGVRRVAPHARKPLPRTGAPIGSSGQSPDQI
jgi:DNA-binding LacI/PurR family transcriptional regulator